MSEMHTEGHDDIHKRNVLRDLSPELGHQLVQGLERVLFEERFGIREQCEHARGGGLRWDTHGGGQRKRESVRTPSRGRVSFTDRDASADARERLARAPIGIPKTVMLT